MAERQRKTVFKTDDRGQTQPANKEEAQKTGQPSPAGPHDTPTQTDHEKTPGAGALSDDKDAVNTGTG
jgi:hypothetical protein